MDIFISHASEDKEEVARPIAAELRKRNVQVWYDEYALLLGDNLRRKIDEGLAQCRFGIVILSPHFFSKQWPQMELDGLAAREISKGAKVILPIWHNITKEQVEKYSPSLAGRLAVSTTAGLQTVVEQIMAVVNSTSEQAKSEELSVSGASMHQDVSLAGATDFNDWCINLLLKDQFTEGDATGAWSRRYPDYLKFLYGQHEIPGDISVRDTISYSAWIANALQYYARAALDQKKARLIFTKLYLLRDYLRRHYHKEVGGFGLATRPKSRGPVGIEVDLRHTCWAMLTLWQFESGDALTDEMLRRAGAHVRSQLQRLDQARERAITYAVLHRLLTAKGLSEIVLLSETSRRAVLKRIESILVERFDRVHGSWDLEFDPVERCGIDNALFFLYTVTPESCIDPDCTQTLKLAATHLLEANLITLDDRTSAIPFYEGGEPDIGATVLLLYILKRNQVVFSESDDILHQLAGFIKNEENHSKYAEFAYPWHLAAALYLC
jgi:hypothetical protein